MTEPCLETTTTENSSWLRVHGRATYASARILRTFLESCIHRGPHKVQIDLGQCQSMDSTFIGVLTKSAMGGNSDALKVFMVNAPEHVARQISGLGLSRFFEFVQNTPPVSEWKCLEESSGVEQTQKQQLRETMLQAHETLGQADPDNIARFKNVVAALKQE